MSNNLKHIRKTLNVNDNSLDEVITIYEEFKKTLPENAVNIKTCFETEGDYDSTSTVLEITYYIPKTEEDIDNEKRAAVVYQERQRTLYLDLKKKFENG